MILLVAMLALFVGSCATVQVDRVPDEATAQDAAFMQAAELASRNATLQGRARAANIAEIERLLGTLDDQALQANAAGMAPDGALTPFVARALLARGLPLPEQLAASAWQFAAGSRPPAAADGYQPPQKLALLLPLTGKLAKAAAPVRDGFLAGYYGETRPRPEITFYDTHGTSGGALAAYAGAVAAGNDFVVGPLSREAVAALFASANLSVPILALNRAGDTPPVGHVSFSLSPEDEGVAAAELLLSRNARQALLLVGYDDGMRRAAEAFRKHYQQHGGHVVASLDVGGDVDALGPRLQAAAQAEGGVDAVFLAVEGPQARELVPQLSLAGLGGAMRVATSELMAGSGDPQTDRVLDGIAYPSETWYVQGIPGLPPAASLGTRLPTARGGAAKLFAFGYDAWLLTAYPSVAAGRVEGGLRGATGRLRIGPLGNVLRMPTWSTFSNGHPVPLGTGAQP